MRVINSLWFNNWRGVAGLVIGEDESTGERKAYISVVDGHQEFADQLMVLENGVQISQGVLEDVLKKLKGGK